MLLKSRGSVLVPGHLFSQLPDTLVETKFNITMAANQGYTPPRIELRFTHKRFKHILQNEIDIKELDSRYGRAASNRHCILGLGWKGAS